MLSTEPLIVYEQGDEGWVVTSIPEVPGAHSQGRTREEARANEHRRTPRDRAAPQPSGLIPGATPDHPSYSDEDGGYIADIPDLEACSAFGASPEEALAEVAKSKEAWLAAAREAGKPIPEPRYRPAIYTR